ncbi:BnaCnng16500D [Brassica napus]|uniref:BnaCnng16500D protein n=1 Tax=Brassica napus TaxID=3708 RepID=A0A078IF11_BRANA|nr:BnaCnng16500D [Brassica napus]
MSTRLRLREWTYNSYQGDVEGEAIGTEVMEVR